MEIIKRLVREEEGQGMVEYALIAALISIAALAVLTPLGAQIKVIYNNVLDALGGTKVS